MVTSGSKLAVTNRIGRSLISWSDWLGATGMPLLAATAAPSVEMKVQEKTCPPSRLAMRSGSIAQNNSSMENLGKSRKPIRGSTNAQAAVALDLPAGCKLVRRLAAAIATDFAGDFRTMRPPLAFLRLWRKRAQS